MGTVICINLSAQNQMYYDYEKLCILTNGSKYFFAVFDFSSSELFLSFTSFFIWKEEKKCKKSVFRHLFFFSDKKRQKVKNFLKEVKKYENAKKKYFDQLLCVCSTLILVKIHNIWDSSDLKVRRKREKVVWQLQTQ